LQDAYKGKLTIITLDFLAETLKSRKAWIDIFQALKVNNCQSRWVEAGKQSFKVNGSKERNTDLQRKAQTKIIHDHCEDYS
jgi:hypothetical protein